MIYQEESFTFHYLINDLVGYNENLLVLEENPRVLDMIFTEYQKVIKVFYREFLDFKEIDDVHCFQQMTLSRMYLFNFSIIEMFEKFNNKRSKMELVVQYEIYEIIPQLIDVLL